MTTQALPRTPDYCFAPSYDIDTETQHVVLVIQGLPGHVRTALVALDLDAAVNICDCLNRRLGHDRDAWTAMVAASMGPGPRSEARTLH